MKKSDDNIFDYFNSFDDETVEKISEEYADLSEKEVMDIYRKTMQKATTDESETVSEDAVTGTERVQMNKWYIYGSSVAVILLVIGIIPVILMSIRNIPDDTDDIVITSPATSCTSSSEFCTDTVIPEKSETTSYGTKADIPETMTADTETVYAETDIDTTETHDTTDNSHESGNVQPAGEFPETVTTATEPEYIPDYSATKGMWKLEDDTQQACYISMDGYGGYSIFSSDGLNISSGYLENNEPDIYEMYLSNDIHYGHIYFYNDSIIDFANSYNGYISKIKRIFIDSDDETEGIYNVNVNDTLVIKKLDENKYSVTISFYRMSTTEGYGYFNENGIFVFVDSLRDGIGGEITFDGDNAEVTFAESCNEDTIYHNMSESAN